ncbi:threonine/serine exporter family protein [Helicovermis profundi]|uniref:Threonine/serine exporter family protein n=1 Tax=Helicovermis profundi TaxID=3065157 RepID=A0AAU9E1H7_9FIRM|nr:threonine/serine exporter family protein [Clostridia bacterium S502]
MSKYLKEITNIAISIGKLILENGGEAYRVEDTIRRMCESKGIENVNVLSLPTGIFLSASYEDEEFTVVRRTFVNRIDLEIIDLCNTFSREFINKEINYEASLKRIKGIQDAPSYSLFLSSIFAGMGGGFFTLLFKSTALEFFLAFIISFIVSSILSRIKVGLYMKHLIGGFLVALLSFTASAIFLKVSMDYLVVGSIMPLVPGVAMVNSIRDILNGDLVSGMGKMTEAIVVATSIAFGVGSVLGVLYFMEVI